MQQWKQVLIDYPPAAVIAQRSCSSSEHTSRCTVDGIVPGTPGTLNEAHQSQVWTCLRRTHLRRRSPYGTHTITQVIAHVNTLWLTHGTRLLTGGEKSVNYSALSMDLRRLRGVLREMENVIAEAKPGPQGATFPGVSHSDGFQRPAMRTAAGRARNVHVASCWLLLMMHSSRTSRTALRWVWRKNRSDSWRLADCRSVPVRERVCAHGAGRRQHLHDAHAAGQRAEPAVRGRH